MAGGHQRVRRRPSRRSSTTSWPRRTGTSIPGAHFSETPDFMDSWPPHCVAGTHGAELHPDLDTEYIQAYFHKGQYTAAYSGFEGLLAPEDAVPTGERQPGALPSPATPGLRRRRRRDRPGRLAAEPRRGGRRGGGPRHRLLRHGHIPGRRPGRLLRHRDQAADGRASPRTSTTPTPRWNWAAWTSTLRPARR